MRRPGPRMTVGAIALAALLGEQAAGARAPRPGQLPAAPAAAVDEIPPAIRIDAVVTDRQGRAVVDLRPGDFELRINGVAQPIAGVEFRRAVTGTPEAAAIASREDELRAAAEPGTRVFAFLLDEFHVSPGEPTRRVREAMTRFIDQHLRPADLALVLKPLDQVTSLRFTRDRASLAAAVASFSGRKGDLSPRSAFEQQFIGHAPAAIAAARAQIVTVALTELALHLGELRADAGTVVLMSEGFARPPASRRQSRLPELQGVVRAASRFHFSVYAFSPADPASEPPQNAGTLEWLATQTGGTVTLDGSALPPALDRMASNLDGYYALTVRPASADGRFHPIEIRTRRAGLAVRARPGFWAPMPGEWLARMSASSAPSTPRRALRRSPLIEAWTGLAPDEAGRPRLGVAWTPVAFVNRRSPVPATIDITARSPAGAVLFAGSIAAVGAAGARPDIARFIVPPGRVELDLRVRAPDGSQLDVDTRDVTVPEAAASAPLSAPEVVRARTLLEYRNALANPDAAPTANRVFARGDRLLVRVPVWADPPGLEIVLRVLNRRGQPMRTIRPMPPASNGIVAFELPLAWLAPGEYHVEAIATTPAGPRIERFSMRVIS